MKLWWTLGAAAFAAVFAILFLSFRGAGRLPPADATSELRNQSASEVAVVASNSPANRQTKQSTPQGNDVDIQPTGGVRERSGAAASDKISSQQTAVPTVLESSIQNAPWLSYVQEMISEISLRKKFSDNIALSAIECAGAKCVVSGSIQVPPNINPGMAVSQFVDELQSHDIVGDNNERKVGLSSVQMKSSGGTFAITVEENVQNASGQPQRPVMACEDILRAWQKAHPEDFTTGSWLKAL